MNKNFYLKISDKSFDNFGICPTFGPQSLGLLSTTLPMYYKSVGCPWLMASFGWHTICIKAFCDEMSQVD